MVDPKAAGKKPDEKAEPAVCKDPDMMEELATYVAGEINTNIHHPSVLKMKELLSYDVAKETRKQMELPWYAQVGATSPQAIGAANVAAAMALWTERVGQGRKWDHKVALAKMYDGVVYHQQGDYDYFYDIWSNIHYGYVGRAGGLSESALADGAALEQIASESVRERYSIGRNGNGRTGLKASMACGLTTTIRIGYLSVSELNYSPSILTVASPPRW